MPSSLSHITLSIAPALVAAMAFFLIAAVICGRKLARQRHVSTQILLHYKKLALNYFAGFTVLFLVIIESDVHFAPHHPLPLDWIRIVHYGADAIFFVSFLLLRLRLTGIRTPKIHKPLAYICIGVFFALVVPTGLVEVSRLGESLIVSY